MAVTPIDSAFAYLLRDQPGLSRILSSFHAQMAIPERVYHNEAHVADVLKHLFAWTEQKPSRALVAAALYHDIVYDPNCSDNELQSAVLCHTELSPTDLPMTDIIQAVTLIMATAYHRPHLQNKDEVLLVDADLYVLGGSPKQYRTYAEAIREEYAAVPEPQWRVGRSDMIRRFLLRDRIFHGDWPGYAEREAQARANIAAEIEALA